MEAWLLQTFTKYGYRSPSQAQQDALALLNTYRSLRPKVEKFVHPNGTESMYLQLAGTLPVVYKGVQYNIPVCFWLRETHPSVPPLVYVVPTGEMIVRPGRHVDANGTVYLPELHSWNATSNLCLIARRLCDIFGSEPPVYSKPSPPSIPNPSSNPYFPPPNPSRSSFDARSVYSPLNPALVGISDVERKKKEQEERELTERKVLHESLVSAVSEQVRRRLCERSETTTADINAQFRIQARLKAGNEKIQQIMLEMQTEAKKVADHKITVQQKIDEIKTALEKVEQQPEIDVDATVVSTTPLYNQLLDLVAEEYAYNDALYYLGRALNKQVIDLPVYLKCIRSVARKQFIVIATMIKARNMAGLRPV